MVILKTAITFQHNIKSICLPTKQYSSADIVGENGTVAGWGSYSDEETITGIPKISQVLIASDEECWNSSNVINLYMSDRSFCSTPESFQRRIIGKSILICFKKTSCRYDIFVDSGSGLCFKEKGSWTIRGIVSFLPSEKSDRNFHVAYTDVAQFVDWIEEVMQKM